MPCITKEERAIRKVQLGPLIKRADHNMLMKSVERCNSECFYEFKVRQAREIIVKANEMFSGNLPIAFSGGKDSLAVLHIALDVNPNLPVIYNNTTVEFPETLRYVRDLQEKWNFNLSITTCEAPFFSAVRERGWANHENRWCCKPYKEEPALQYMLSKNCKAEITGTTRTESIYRRSLSPIKIPRKEPYMLRVNPIYDWNEWEVWRYINENNLRHNPLYDRGYRRIGYWCCPLNGPSHYKRLRKTHPKLYDFHQHFEPRHPNLENTK